MYILYPFLKSGQKTLLSHAWNGESMVPDIGVAISEVANSLLDRKSRIRVLEAGCGSASHVSLVADTHIVGIDISEQQLEKNSAVQEKILGDIQTYALPEGEFDVVVCWMVLEHLPKPKDALANLFRAVKPGGLLILAAPNLMSIKGFVTRATPFWFHELFYRFMKYDFRPFPTYLRAVIMPKRLARFAKTNGYSLVFFKLLEGSVAKKLRARFPVADRAFLIVDTITRMFSFGRCHSLLLDNYFMILRRGGDYLGEGTRWTHALEEYPRTRSV